MSKHPPCELITWQRVYSLSRILARRIRMAEYHPDIIVAIGRGGYVPARILADLLGLMALTGIRIEHYHGAHKGAIARIKEPLSVDISGRRVLLVDDVSDSGDTFEVAIRHLLDYGRPAEIRSATLHHKKVSRIEPDFYAARIVKWRWLIYPWAVIEDLTSFASEMKPVPQDIHTLGRRLLQERGIKAPTSSLEDVLTLLNAEA